MSFQAVTWSGGDLLTSQKFAQMVENILAHDHRVDGTRGAPRMRIQTGWTSSFFYAANAWTDIEQEYGFRNNQNSGEPWFDPAGPLPIVVMSPEASGQIGGSIKAWRTRNESHTGFTAGMFTTGASGIGSFRWVAVQAIV